MRATPGGRLQLDDTPPCQHGAEGEATATILSWHTGAVLPPTDR